MEAAEPEPDVLKRLSALGLPHLIEDLGPDQRRTVIAVPPDAVKDVSELIDLLMERAGWRKVEE